MRQQHIIGIAGAFGSGKTTASQLLENLGYQRISLGQFLEEELVARGEKEITRKKLQDIGNEWRVKYGNDVLVRKALDLVRQNNWEKVVIEGYRNSDEVLTLRKSGLAVLISLIVNRETRFRRLKQLKRREKLTKDLFDELDNRDLGIGEGEHGLQTAICIAMADVFIENNGTVRGLATKLRKIVKEYE